MQTRSRRSIDEYGEGGGKIRRGGGWEDIGKRVEGVRQVIKTDSPLLLYINRFRGRAWGNFKFRGEEAVEGIIGS